MQVQDKPQKQSVNFVYYWGNTDRSLAWSGTPWGLFNAFKNCVVLNDIPLKYHTTVFNLLIRRFIKFNDFNIGFTKKCQKQINSTSVKEGPILMFTEFNTDFLERSYMYQDLTVDYLCRLKESNSDLLKYTPLTPDIKNIFVNYRRKTTRYVNEGCKGIFTMSKWLADDLIDSGIDSFKVHHVGGGCNIDTSLIDTSRKNGDKFLFIGKQWELKNGPLVVQAFCNLLKSGRKVHLYIAGPQQCPKDISEINPSFRDNIHFLGRISYSDVAKYMNICDYFVMPSKFEAYGLAFVEALVFGLPCIAKNAFAMPEFITNNKNGFLINEDDADELTECMDKMLYSSSIIEKVKNDREIYIKQYSWDSVVKRITDVFIADGFIV